MVFVQPEDQFPLWLKICLGFKNYIINAVFEVWKTQGTAVPHAF